VHRVYGCVPICVLPGLGFVCLFFFFSSRRRHTRFKCDWSSDVCSSDLATDLTPTAFSPHFRAPILQRYSLNLQTELANNWMLERSEERRVGKECRSRWWTSQ